VRRTEWGALREGIGMDALVALVLAVVEDEARASRAAATTPETLLRSLRRLQRRTATVLAVLGEVLDGPWFARSVAHRPAPELAVPDSSRGEAGRQEQSLGAPERRRRVAGEWVEALQDVRALVEQWAVSSAECTRLARDVSEWVVEMDADALRAAALASGRAAARRPGCTWEAVARCCARGALALVASHVVRARMDRVERLRLGALVAATVDEVRALAQRWADGTDDDDGADDRGGDEARWSQGDDQVVGEVADRVVRAMRKLTSRDRLAPTVTQGLPSMLLRAESVVLARLVVARLSPLQGRVWWPTPVASHLDAALRERVDVKDDGHGDLEEEGDGDGGVDEEFFDDLGDPGVRVWDPARVLSEDGEEEEALERAIQDARLKIQRVRQTLAAAQQHTGRHSAWPAEPQPRAQSAAFDADDDPLARARAARTKALRTIAHSSLL
jgi:hypothetical protein